MLKEDILLKVKKLMERHKGAANSISAGEIASRLDLKQEDTHVEPRKYIYQAMKQYRIPIGAGGKGYYLITSREELERYLTTLGNRAAKIELRRQETAEIFNEYYS